MISVASEKNISTAKKRDIAPFKVNGQSHIILLSCGTRSKVSFVSNPALISLKHSSQLTNKTTLATSFIYCVNQMFIQFTIKSSWKYQSILNQYCHTKLQDLLQNPSKSLSNTQQLANQLYGGVKTIWGGPECLKCGLNLIYKMLPIKDRCTPSSLNKAGWRLSKSGYLITYPPCFKGILSTSCVIISYPKLLSISVLTFIKWRLNTELLMNTLRNVVFSTKKADHRYRKLIIYALTWARPTLFIYLFLCQ